MEDSLIKSLIDNLKGYPVVFAYLFGSQAKDQSTTLSDVDIAIFIDRTMPKSERFDIRLRLSNNLSAITKRTVDLIVMNDIPIQLAYEIIKHGKVLLCKDRDAMIDVEVEILSKYLDRRYYDKRRAKSILKKIETGGLI